MASQFKRKLSSAVGTSPVTVGGYTVPAGAQVTVIGMVVNNVTGAVIKASVMINDGVADTYLMGGNSPATEGAEIYPGGAAVVVGGDQKVVLEPGDSVKVVCDQANAADVVLSILEITEG